LEFTTIKGFKDILPEEVGSWQKLEKETRKLFECFGFQEIRMPILERNEVFSRGIGEETDIVSKEMYRLEDSKGMIMTLRPEATASIVRAYIQQRLYLKNPVQKLYTIGPMFRHERPQKGRYRQFHQIDAEIFGDAGPKSDADVILLAVRLLEAVSLPDLTLVINSLGCRQCRAPFREKLRQYLAEKDDSLCKDCRRRAQLNPLRVFDCKLEQCRVVVAGAPSILDFLCDECLEHFESVKQYLSLVGVGYRIDHKLVRGLDYYARTTFEIQTDLLGAQNAVAGGGRYDGLVRLLGGPDHPAVGFAMGMERLVALLEGNDFSEGRRPDLFIAALGERAEKEVFKWTDMLRSAGLWAEAEYSRKGLKAQMKKADRMGARKVLMVGEDELASGRAVLRDMATKDQEEVGLDNISADLIERLRS